MSKRDENYRELDEKIDKLSEQIGNLYKVLLELHEATVEITGSIAQWLEEKRKEEERTKKKFEIALNYWSLIMGLLLGVLGNLFSSYFMEFLKFLGVPPFIFGISALGALLGVLIIVAIFYKKIKSLGVELKAI